MNARPAIAPIANAWDSFRGVAHIGHIANRRDYEEATRVADELLEMGAIREAHPSHSLFMTICDLIAAYDQRHHAMPEVRGVQVLRFLMEQHDLKQNQLPEIGRQSVVSEILAGKRNLTVEHIKNLARRFGISPAAFF
ncbi:helix-turn-helix domain-containing protein [Rhodanobacter lindaniclasticus]